MASSRPASKDRSITGMLCGMPVFKDLDDSEIMKCLECSGAESVIYEKGEKIFSEGEMPLRLPVILSGSVVTGRDFYDGKRTIAAVYDRQGDVFGYELLFSPESRYGLFAEAQTKTHLIMIPKKYLIGTCERNCGFHATLISNMLFIMADKSLKLNAKLEIMTCSTIRQKVAKMLLYESVSDPSGDALNMRRQDMADFINVARPSLSRELMKMQEEGLIETSGRKIYIKDKKALESIIR